MKKRILTFVLAICLLIPGLFVFAGCNDKPDVAVGTYQLESVQFQGQQEAFTKEDYQTKKNDLENLSPEEQGVLTMLGMYFETDNKITLNKDNTATMLGMGETRNGTWTRTDKIVKITTTVEEQTQTMEFALQDNFLIITEQGSTLTYKKA